MSSLILLTTALKSGQRLFPPSDSNMMALLGFGCFLMESIARITPSFIAVNPVGTSELIAFFKALLFFVQT